MSCQKAFLEDIRRAARLDALRDVAAHVQAGANMNQVRLYVGREIAAIEEKDRAVMAELRKEFSKQENLQ